MPGDKLSIDVAAVGLLIRTVYVSRPFLVPTMHCPEEKIVPGCGCQWGSFPSLLQRFSRSLALRGSDGTNGEAITTSSDIGGLW